MSRRTNAVYRKFYGPVPRDRDGRSYDIHHIDGNSSNDHPSNLKALTIRQHYAVHWKQHDYTACRLIALRLGKSPKLIAKLTSLSNKKRMEAGEDFAGRGKALCAKMLQEGTHPWVGPANNRRMVENGTHPLLGGAMQRAAMRKRVAEGTHNMLGGDVQRKRVLEGTHNFLGGKLQRDRVLAGTHPWQKHPTHRCPHCGKKGKSGVMFRWHFDNCAKVA